MGSNSAIPSVEHFFQFSLLGLVASAFCALADTGRLDLPSLAFLLAGVCWRGLVVAGIVKLRIPQKLITVLATAYLIFYPIDFYFLSHDFFAATAHGVCFLGVARILSARTNRDYLYTGSLAFIALIGAAALSTQPRFFLWLALAVLFGLGVMTSAEIRRGFQFNSLSIASAGARTGRRTGWTLAILVGSAASGILVLTAALFFVLPRTARAAAAIFPNGPRLTGFTNAIELGRFGPVAKDDRPVLHVRSYGAALPPGLKWRGSALSLFNGRRWSELHLPADIRPVQGTATVADLWQRSRRDGQRMLYRVDVSNSDSGTLFIAGVPEFINVDSTTLIRTAEDSYRAPPSPGEPLAYEVSAQQAMPLPYPLSKAERVRDLELPVLDARIPELGKEWAASGPDTSDLEIASRIEQRLHRGFTYSLDTSAEAASRDPLLDFLFVTKRGYCEYFASAMAVLLRTQGIPARVATGFQSGYFNDVSGSWVIRASDAHAWVEAWIEGRGWVTFDPTPPGSASGAGGWLKLKLRRMNMYLDAADTAWQQWVMAYNPGQQATLALGFRDRLLSIGGSGAGVTWPLKALTTAAWWTFSFLLTALLAWLVRSYAPRIHQWWDAKRRIGKIRSGEGTPHDARLLYERMLESMARRGYQKPAWFTPAEFARNLPPEDRERIGAFTAAYNKVRFGGDAAGAVLLTQMLESMETAGWQ